MSQYVHVAYQTGVDGKNYQDRRQQFNQDVVNCLLYRVRWPTLILLGNSQRNFTWHVNFVQSLVQPEFFTEHLIAKKELKN